MRGPVLLDLAEVYQSSVETLSYIFLCSSTGSLFGSFFGNQNHDSLDSIIIFGSLAGFIMDKYPDHQGLILFFFNFFFGALTMIVPYTGYVSLLMVIYFFIGFNSAGCDAGGNIICLHVWRGLDSGPAMHSIHFSFAAGGFLAPLLAIPFLSERAQILDVNATTAAVTDDQDLSSATRIHYLFPLIGMIGVVISFGFLIYHCFMYKAQRRGQGGGTEDKDGSTKWTRYLNNHHPFFLTIHNIHCRPLVIVIVPISLFFFIYVGIEYALGIYFTTFGVASDLRLSKAQGAELTAIFFGCFAVSLD